MRYIKRFNENSNHIEEKDKQETIDEVLDSLSNKGKLSKSEEKFMLDASNDAIIKISTPNPSGNIWSDMSNPHNIGIMWIGSDNVWHILKSIEDEEDDALSKSESSDQSWERSKRNKLLKISEDLPELKEVLIDAAKEMIKQNSKISDYKSKISKMIQTKNSDYKYDINTRVDYAFKSLDGMLNQFGPLIGLEIDDDGKYKIKQNG